MNNEIDEKQLYVMNKMIGKEVIVKEENIK